MVIFYFSLKNVHFLRNFDLVLLKNLSGALFHFTFANTNESTGWRVIYFLFSHNKTKQSVLICHFSLKNNYFFRNFDLVLLKNLSEKHFYVIFAYANGKTCWRVFCVLLNCQNTDKRWLFFIFVEK